eukprot:392836_1
MGFFSSDNAFKTDMDIPDLENQRRDVKPRSTSNYLIPTVLFGLFLLVLIPGLNYYIATVSSGDQSAHFAKETAEHEAMIAELEGTVKALEDQSAQFALETAERVAKLLKSEGVVKAL